MLPALAGEHPETNLSRAADSTPNSRRNVTAQRRLGLAKHSCNTLYHFLSKPSNGVF
jgi:hypothetical protein